MNKHKKFFRTDYSDIWLKGVTHYKLEEGKIEKYFLDLLLTSIDQQKAYRILEVAVGTGQPIAEIICNLKNVEFHGFDINTRFLKEAFFNCRTMTGIIADAENIPYKNCMFDVVYCSRAIFFLEDPEKTIRDMIRITKKGGHILFDIQNGSSPYIKYSILKAKIKLYFIMNPFKKLKDIFLNKRTSMRFIYTLPIPVKTVISILREESVKNMQCYCFNLAGEFVGSGLRKHPPKILFSIIK